ncbi:MAG: GTP-binding protein, partial [Oscillospiraceae bacterium]
MKEYEANNIKNVAVVGHGGSGKTSLIEAMLFKAGCTDRLGKIADGNTVSDYDAEEIKRRASLNLSIVPVEFQGTKLNLLDAPGLFDFALGMGEGIRAAESVLIAVSGKSGVTVGAKKAYKSALKQQKSRMIFVTKMDQEHADFYKVLESLKTNFGPSICPLVVPYVRDSKVECYIDLVDMKAYTYKNGTREEVPMPDSEHRLEGLVSAISEAVAETDEALFDKYFSGEKYTHEEMIQGIHHGIVDGTITPVFCGSSLTLDGIDLMMESMITMLPSAGEGKEEGVSGEDIVELSCDPNAAPVAFVFKTIADPFVGKLSYVKVICGKLVSDTELINMTTGQPEKIGKILFVRGKKQEEIKEIKAGDICAISKLNANTGDTLCSSKNKVTLMKAEFPESCYLMTIRPIGKGDESKISLGITRLLEEDPTLSFIIDK